MKSNRRFKKSASICFPNKSFELDRQFRASPPAVPGTKCIEAIGVNRHPTLRTKRVPHQAGALSFAELNTLNDPHFFFVFLPQRSELFGCLALFELRQCQFRFESPDLPVSIINLSLQGFKLLLCELDSGFENFRRSVFIDQLLDRVKKTHNCFGSSKLLRTADNDADEFKQVRAEDTFQRHWSFAAFVQVKFSLGRFGVAKPEVVDLLPSNWVEGRFERVNFAADVFERAAVKLLGAFVMGREHEVLIGVRSDYGNVLIKLVLVHGHSVVKNA